MSSLHIAILDEELPYPPTSGKRIRTWELLRRLAGRHRLTYIAHRQADLDEAIAAQEAMAALGVECRLVERSIPRQAGAGFYARLAGNLLSPLPYSVAVHASGPLVRAVQEHAAARRVDLWHCEWTPYAQVLRRAFGAELARRRWLVMAHNVESVIWQRHAAAARQPLKRWYIRQQQVKYERFERWAYAAASLTVAVSGTDARRLRQQFAAPRVAVVENGVDLDAFQPQRDVDRLPHQLLFLGSLDWRPNQDAVELLLRQIFPRVRAAVPHAQLLVVGRRPPESLRRRAAATPGVRLVPDVPDVRPFLASCGLLVVPLRIAGGTRLKILEALACETPIVSTRIGAEGLDLVPGRDLLIADSVEEMIAAILAAIRRPDEVQEMAARGRETIRRRHAWPLLADKLEAAWHLAAGSPPPHAGTEPLLVEPSLTELQTESAWL